MCVCVCVYVCVCMCVCMNVCMLYVCVCVLMCVCVNVSMYVTTHECKWNNKQCSLCECLETPFNGVNPLHLHFMGLLDVQIQGDDIKCFLTIHSPWQPTDPPLPSPSILTLYKLISSCSTNALIRSTSFCASEYLQGDSY